MIGSLEPGKWADFILASRDLFKSHRPIFGVPLSSRFGIHELGLTALERSLNWTSVIAQVKPPGEPETKERILCTAFPLFREQGFYATRVVTIGREAGINPGSLDNFFKGSRVLGSSRRGGTARGHGRRPFVCNSLPNPASAQSGQLITELIQENGN